LREISPAVRGFESHLPHHLYTPTALYNKQKERIVNFLIFLNSKGLRESTIIGYSKALKHLAKHVDLDDTHEARALKKLHYPRLKLLHLKDCMK
jgi:hypothetical protein